MPRPRSRACPATPLAVRLMLPALLVLAALGLLGGISSAEEPDAFVPDELLVGFRAGVTDDDAEAVYRPHGAAKLEKLRGLNVHRIRLAPSQLDAVERVLASQARVKFVERNRRLAPAMVPSDPSYPSEWHLPKVSAPAAWDIVGGAGQITIAILDSGVETTHPDLTGHLVPGYNFYTGNADTSDVFGHGTRVAGAAAAMGNNSVGVAGVAWNARIMPIRVSDSTGYAYYSTIANGLTWAADHGARVMNISIGGVAASSTISSAAQYVRSKGGVVVAAAGNCGCVDATPENPYLISVSATDSADNLAAWSSQGNYVDVSAPGLGILTTDWGNGYASVSGTSFSSPITAGVVALMMAANPSLTPAETEALLKANADDMGTGGWDPAYGYGRVNAWRAVAAAATSAPAPDLTRPSVTITSPAGGSSLSGTITVSVSASDNVGVSRVDLHIDGVLYVSDTASPYGFSWNTTTATNGPHTLVAKAYDAAGNEAVSGTITITVNNVADTTPPTVAITSLNSKRNWVKVSVSATDNVAVSRVELYLDGALVGSSTSSNPTFTVNTRSLSPGFHSLNSKAYDQAGNVGSSGSGVTFTQ